MVVEELNHHSKLMKKKNINLEYKFKNFLTVCVINGGGSGGCNGSDGGGNGGGGIDIAFIRGIGC